MRAAIHCRGGFAPPGGLELDHHECLAWDVDGQGVSTTLQVDRRGLDGLLTPYSSDELNFSYKTTEDTDLLTISL